MSLFLITAFSNDFIIGLNNKLPWNYNEDLQYFKLITNNSICVMGFNTFKSLKYPLKDRINIVINNNVHGLIFEEGFYHVHSLEKAIEYSKNIYPKKNIFIIGGSSIYKESLHKYDFSKIYITKINISLHNLDSTDEKNYVYFPINDLLNKYVLLKYNTSLKHPEIQYQQWVLKNDFTLYYEVD